MLKIKLAFLFLFTVNLYSCYLCSVTDPTVYAYTKLISDQNKVNYIEVKWEFSKLYAAGSAQVYDNDKDGDIDSQEIQEVEKTFFQILRDNKYHTTLHINGEAVDIMDKIIDERVELTYKTLISYFTIKVDQEITKDLSLTLDFIDNNGILVYYVKPNSFQHNLLDIAVRASVNEHPSLPVEISFSSEQFNIQPREVKEQEKSLSVALAEVLSSTSNKINRLIVDIKENSSQTSLFLLLFFSFIYGIIHAAGPGHGKSLVASYMFSHKKDIKKALWISTIIAFVHVFSAFVMTFGIYYILNEFFTKYINSTEAVITKISGVIIILIALSMLIRKIKVARENKKYKFSLHKPSCACSACNISNKTTDLGVIIGAGIIPCPGTVTIFIFTLSLGAYFIGFLAALVMSIGMSVIIFLTAALSISLRKRVENNSLSLILEYFSLIFILLLGIFLTFY